MTLLEILVQELPKRGGWPDGSSRVLQTDDAFIRFPDIGDHCDFLANSTANGKRVATRDEYEAALAASKTAWNGEGLPPLNTEVEFVLENAITPKWNRCKVMGYSEFGVAIQPFQGEFAGHTVWWAIPGKGENVRFRPVRSEADRKRDEAAFEVQKIFDNCNEDMGNNELARFGERIIQKIAAGKIPHLKIV